MGIAAAILLAMLLLTCADVIGRYLLNAPINGKTELTRFMMAGLIACALPVIGVTGLAGRGVKEINLLGQNVNAYDGELHEGGRADLALLIHYVAAIEGIERIRFTTSHPVEFSPGMIEA